MLNARIRKRWRQGGAAIGLIGERVDLTYPYEYLGAGPQTLKDVADGKHSFAATLREAKHPMVIVGAAAAARPDGAAVLALAARIALAAGQGKDAGWNAFNVLHTAASRVAGLDLGFVPGEGGLDVAAHAGRGGRRAARRRLPARRRRDRHGARSARPSWSTRAATAMPARSAPT